MSNWVNRCSLNWLAPMYEMLKEDLLGRELLFADETTLQVLREPGKDATSKSYMWLYRTGDDELEHPLFSMSTSHQDPSNILSGT